VGLGFAPIPWSSKSQQIVSFINVQFKLDSLYWHSEVEQEFLGQHHQNNWFIPYRINTSRIKVPGTGSF
jgi:hypothetical protein